MRSAAEPFLDRSDLTVQDIHASPEIRDGGVQMPNAPFRVAHMLLDASEPFLDLAESSLDPVESRVDPVESFFYPRQTCLDRRALGFEAVELRQERVVERLHLIPESAFRAANSLADDSLNVGQRHLAMKRGEGAREGTDGERLVGHPRHPTPFRAAIIHRFRRARNKPEGESATSRDEATAGTIKGRSAPLAQVA
jgi:hypothetical protein